MDKEGKGFEDILRERERLESDLMQFKRRLAVIFIDIKGSTDYFDKWGDTEGALMVQKCDDIMLPLIVSHGGKSKGLGDGAMAYFEDTVSAVRCAQGVLMAFREYNAGAGKSRAVHVRIGVNAGEIFIKSNDISGMAVSMAKRLESAAPVDGICISREVYEGVRDDDDIICRYMSEMRFKGISEPVSVYQVLWSEEELTVKPLRGASAPEPVPDEHETRRYYLEYQLEGQVVKVRGYEGSSGEESTVNTYEESQLSLENLLSYSAKIQQVLNRANQGGRLDKELLHALKEAGHLLYDEIVPPKTKASLKSTGMGVLVLRLDERLVGIPWELIYDGEAFLGRRFSMGRVVNTRQEFRARQREMSLPLRMLLLADPQENLAESYREGQLVRDRLDEHEDVVNVKFKSGPIAPEYVMGKMRFFDILHYAGHAQFDAGEPLNSGLLLDGGRLTVGDLGRMSGGMPMPSLVFANACNSARAEVMDAGKSYLDVYGLASAFLMSGVRHYLGALWEVQDEPSGEFAVCFYGELVRGSGIGESVRAAREALIRKYGEESLVWASYMLYGDPGYKYVRRSMKKQEPMDDDSGVETVDFGSDVRTGEDVAVFPQRVPVGRAAYAVAAVLIMALVGYFVYGRDPGAGSGQQTVVADVSRAEGAPDAETTRALVDDLARRYREGDVPEPPAHDGWTSMPLSLAFMDVRGAGVDEGKIEFILTRAGGLLGDRGRVGVVDRAMIGRLIQELNLGSSELADRQTALRLGRVLSARLMASGRIARDSDGWTISLRVIETETSSVVASVAVSVAGDERPEDLAVMIVEELTRRLIQAYPIQGKVVGGDGGLVELNVGSIHGVTPGMRMMLYLEGMAEAGAAEVVEVGEDRCKAGLSGSAQGIEAGMLAREII